MKKITLFTVLSILLALTSCDKKEVAPKKVADAFTKKFPTATDVEWEKESETEWEAEFKMNKTEYSANFLSDGTWQETEYEIKVKEVPQNIMASFKKAFPDYEIEEVEISETPKGIVYEFAIEKGEMEMEVTIDTNGKVVKQEVKTEDTKDKD